MEVVQLTEAESLKLQLYKMYQLEAGLRRQILLRDVKIRLQLAVEDRIFLKENQILIEKVEKPCNSKEAPGNSMS